MLWAISEHRLVGQDALAGAQGYLVCEVGRISMMNRAISVTLKHPKLGKVILLSMYGWVDNQSSTLRLMGHSDCREQAYKGEVMSPGATCFTETGGSAIDYMVASKVVARWCWYQSAVDTTLDTHKAVVAGLKWKWEQWIEALVKVQKPPVTRRIGPQARPVLEEEKFLLEEIRSFHQEEIRPRFLTKGS